MWRYSCRWSLPHLPCPGPVELAAAEVAPGLPCPAAVMDHWRAGSGYAIGIDFQETRPVRRWSSERRSVTRRRNLTARIERSAPLFADELIERELVARPNYYAGARRDDS